jgi:hypothetical protein
LCKQKCGFAKDKRQKSATITKSIEKVKIPDTDNDQLMTNEGPTDEVDVNITMEEVTQNEGATLDETEAEHQPSNEINQNNLCQSTRIWNPTRQMLQSIAQETLCLPSVSLQVIKYGKDYATCIDYVHPLSMAASADPDTMNWDQSLKQHNRKQLGHWEVIPKNQVPSDTRVLNAVWSMKRKRRLTNNEVYKYKARLNVHGVSKN